MEGSVLQVRSQLMVSLAVTLFLMIALAAFRVRYGLLIGLGIGVADALPVLGAGLFLIPGASPPLWRATRARACWQPACTWARW